MAKRIIGFLFSFCCRFVLFFVPAKYFNGSKELFAGDLCLFFAFDQKALEFYRKAREYFMRDNDVLKRIASTLTKIKAYEEAIEIYQGITSKYQDYEIFYL